MKVLREPMEFDWDQGNRSKNFLRHRVSDTECEEVFFDHRKCILKDTPHSDTEERYLIIGKTKYQRLLFVVFTMRRHKIRIVSARDLNKKERYLYEEAA